MVTLLLYEKHEDDYHRNLFRSLVFRTWEPGCEIVGNQLGGGDPVGFWATALLFGSIDRFEKE